MNNLVFLLVAIGASVVGSVVLWLRTRKPTTVGSSVDSFAREMRALAPGREASGAAEQAPGFRPIGGGQVQPAPPEEPTTGGRRPDGTAPPQDRDA